MANFIKVKNSLINLHYIGEIYIIKESRKEYTVRALLHDERNTFEATKKAIVWKETETEEEAVAVIEQISKDLLSNKSIIDSSDPN